MTTLQPNPGLAMSADAARLLPAWAARRAGVQGPLPQGDARGWSLRAALVPQASTLPAALLRRQTRDAYSRLLDDVARAPAPHLVRMWNFIPAIHAIREESLNTYHVFNQGRHEAFEARAGAGAFAASLPTATGVGWSGDALVIFALSGAAPGRGVENPRQTPAFRYSRKFGPLPPCFARATRVRNELLVGGTASVVGEESRHEHDVPSQVEETLENLAAVGRAALPAGFSGDRDAVLARYTEARAYVSDDAFQPLVTKALARHLPRAAVELVPAAICREELRVEIEGVMDLTP